jgi:hypothetical protein
LTNGDSKRLPRFRAEPVRSEAEGTRCAKVFNRDRGIRIARFAQIVANEQTNIPQFAK